MSGSERPPLLLGLHGVVLAIDLPGSGWEEVILQLLPGSLRVSNLLPLLHFSLVPEQAKSLDGATYTIRENGRRVAASLPISQALAALEHGLQHAIARFSTDHIFIHAGVVACSGRAVLLPGRSGVGKSTLVMELVLAGATYYSDEFAIIDPNGMVLAFPRTPWLRTEDGSKARFTDPSGRFGLLQSKPALLPGLIAVCRYRAGAAWNPRPLTAGEAALILLKQAVAARRYPNAVLAAVSKVASASRAYSCSRGGAAQAAERIFELAALSS